MNNVKSIQKLLETHRIRSKTTEYPSDMPTSVQKCTGCVWIGWNHDQHVAEVIDEAIRNASRETFREALKKYMVSPNNRPITPNRAKES